MSDLKRFIVEVGDWEIELRPNGGYDTLATNTLQKHGSHDQSSHNPHKGGGGSGVSATAASLLANADKGREIDLGSYPENRKSPKDPYGFRTDEAKMGEVITKQGWAEPSTGLTETEFEDLAKNPDFERVYRGAPVDSAQAMVDGKPYIGNGNAGPGTYVTLYSNRAELFAQKQNYKVHEFLVPKKLLDTAQTRRQINSNIVSQYGAQSRFDSDAPQVLSAALGYGAYDAGSATGYAGDYVIWNTSALAVKMGS